MFAVVPAYNEAPTVSDVVRVLRDSGVFEDVVVVDDGSTDGTAAAAERAGAVVISPAKNLGKGGAMLFAVEALRDELGADDRIAFFDADLLGLRADHVRRLAAASKLGYDQVAGLQDRGDVQNVLQVVYSSLLTGQRILKEWVLDALPSTCWSGYSIETAINDVVERGRGKTALVLMDGVLPRTKLAKIGVADGLRSHLKMFQQIARTKKALRSSEGMTCTLGA